MKDLVLCVDGLALPREAIVSKQAVVGMSGSGKTQTARKLAEAMMDIGQHIAILDPTGAWWGLRSSADGEKAGFPIVVFGGEHADAPLRVDSGKMMAAALVKERFNAIFDLSKFDDGEIRRFAAEFLSELYLRNRKPLHLFLDEFDIICPQAKGANSEKVRAVVNNVVRRGRLKGLGSTMIAQNPQDADKSVLNMADTVIAMRTQGSQAIDAIKKWMGRNLSATQVNEMNSSLPALETGSGWLWSPRLNLFSVERFLLCKTFDSSKTPELGEEVVPPKVLAKIDIASLGKRIEAQVKEEQEKSPDYLKKRIAELEAQLESELAKGDKVDMGVLEDIQQMQEELAELRPLRDKAQDFAEAATKISSLMEKMTEDLGSLQATSNDIRFALQDFNLEETSFDYKKAVLPDQAIINVPPPLKTKQECIHADSIVKTGKSSDLESRILQSLAEFEAIGRTQVLRNILSAWAKAKGGYFANTISRMKSEGLIDYPEPGYIGMSPLGRKRAPKVSKPLNPSAFFEAVVAQAGSGLDERIMRKLKAVYPRAISREELSKDVEAKGGYFANTISRLKSAGFIEYPGQGQIRLQAWTLMK